MTRCRRSRLMLAVSSVLTGLAALLTVHTAVRAGAASIARSHAWGTRIAFVRYTLANGHPDIFTISPDGKSPRQLRLPVTAATAPAWSPDGTRLAFIGGKNPPDTSDVTRGDALYVSKADGSNAHRLTGGPDHVRGVAWSPDGKRLVFVRLPAKGSASTLWIVGTDSHHMRRLTAGGIDLEPSWAADGRTIAFLRIDPKTYHSGIWLVRPDRSGLHPILTNLPHVTEPVWSPSGAYLLVEDGRVLYRVRPTGGDRHQLARLSADIHGAREDPEAAWSPDGKTVIFCQLRAGTIGKSDLWLVDADGTALHRLTQSPGLDTNPTWGP